MSCKLYIVFEKQTFRYLRFLPITASKKEILTLEIVIEADSLHNRSFIHQIFIYPTSKGCLEISDKYFNSVFLISMSCG